MKTLEIFVREKQQVDKTTGQVLKSFNTYSTKMKDGKFIQVKFTKKAGYPKFDKRGKIDVKIENMNVSDTGLYPTLWIDKFSNEMEYVRDTSKLHEMF